MATNTSSLSITEVAFATKRPHKVIGMHFFNPAPIMDVLYKETGDTKYRAHSLMRKYVRAGWQGRKSGRGVYQY